MVITKSVFEKIKSALFASSYEAGGILGSEDNTVISHIVIDVPIQAPACACSYSPNIEFLNKQIENWQINQILFKGVFHSHFAGVKTLSKGDIQYIYTILNSMPSEIEYLYFPIFVFPQNELVCYKAIKQQNKISILYEDLYIVDI